MKKYIFILFCLCLFGCNTVFASEALLNEYNTVINKKYDNNYSRVNTAKAICEIIENKGYSLYKNCETYFTDCSDSDVQALRSLGIMVGNGDKTFSPHNQITQQELEITLKRTSDYLDNDKKLLYSDNNFEQGFVYENENYIYYTAPVHGYPIFHYGFYSYCKNTGEKTLIDSLSVANICEYNGRIYYADSGNAVKYIEDNVVFDVGIMCYGDMYIYDGYIYGCVDPRTGGLCRYNVFTQDMEKLSDYLPYYEMVMDKNELYFTLYGEDKLFEMTVGEWNPEIVAEGVKSFSITEDCIYYSTEDSLFKLDKATGETEKILTGYEIIGITVYDGEIYCKFYETVERFGHYFHEPFLGIISDGKLEKVVDESVLYFVVSNGYVYTTINNGLGCFKIDGELQTKNEILSKISLEMSYDEVVENIGMPHMDMGSGVYVFKYRTSDDGLITLCFNTDNKLYKVLDNDGNYLMF